jgi:hypothetical protein
MRAAGVGAGEAGASDMGGDLLDCTKVIIIIIPIFKKTFLSNAVEPSPAARQKAGLSMRKGSPPPSRRSAG